MSFTQRRDSLLRVLHIESELKDIEHGTDYLKMTEAIRILENARAGGGKLVVDRPEDMTNTVELRKNSNEVEEYLVKYRVMMRGVQERVDLLIAEKQRLKAELKGFSSG